MVVQTKLLESGRLIAEEHGDGLTNNVGDIRAGDPPGRGSFQPLAHPRGDADAQLAG
jgi:hypothetical protein